MGWVKTHLRAEIEDEDGVVEVMDLVNWHLGEVLDYNGVDIYAESDDNKFCLSTSTPVFDATRRNLRIH